MSTIDHSAVRAVIVQYVAAQPGNGALFDAAVISDDYDLLLSGAMDSLGFLGLLTAMQDAFGQDLDFDDLEAEEMTVVGPLCRFVAERAVGR